jgi:putative endonuclease
VGSNPTLSATYRTVRGYPTLFFKLWSTIPEMPQFHYVYVLRSLKDGGFYIGSTQDLKARARLHAGGAVRSTKSRRPFELVFYEAYRNEYDAKRRETYLKSTKGRTALKTMLRCFLRGTGSSVYPWCTLRSQKHDRISRTG